MCSHSVHFEQEGVFLGLISYPFYYDGRSLYRDKLEPFFKEHKARVLHHDPIRGNNDDTYQPSGYRIFGSQGLAVLSLVDDYTFFNRHFNKNHIQTLLNDDDLPFLTTVISGITETDGSSGTTLLDAAKNTFLRKKNRYHYLGIIRVKINHELLMGEGRGVQTLREIKSFITQIDKNCKRSTSNNSDYITLDCYDNDEMTVVAFSNDLLYLYNFLGEIRSITNKNIRIPFIGEDKKTDIEKHVFGSALLCFGYDIDFNPSSDKTISDFQMNCLIETKPGHRDALYSYLTNRSKWKANPIAKNMTGGCNIIMTLPLNRIRELEIDCHNNKTFRRDIRKMKVVLKDVDKNRLLSKIARNHASSKNHAVARITKDEVKRTKDLMKEMGVSKLVRERMMALYELYNNSCQNLLQQFYLKELEPTMMSFSVMIRGMKDGGERIANIEEVLNSEIGNMENAIYDRLHLQKHNQPPLEYSGGIQQYLTSFDYAYKYMVDAFSTEEKTGYITITGAERASSTRNLFNLNINDIVFPELFITTAWKEVSNYAIRLFKNDNQEEIDDVFVNNICRLLKIWQEFSENEKSFAYLKYNIVHSDQIMPNDKTCQIVVELMNRELLMYFFKDYIVFRFAFQKNYRLLWHYYFKTMLQTSICYLQLNVVDRKHFIHLLLRLFMLGLLSDDKDSIEFIKEQSTKPFDHLISGYWMEDFDRTWKNANVIFSKLEYYGFKKMNNGLIQIMENNIQPLTSAKKFKEKEFRTNEGLEVYENQIERIIAERATNRKKRIEEMKNDFKEGALVVNKDKGANDFIMCLFYAYLDVLCDLDCHDNIVKSIPRTINGKVRAMQNDKGEELVPGFYDTSIKVLIDPTGGFFVPQSEVRKKYFQLRTVLYRSLWNYRYTNENAGL